MKKRYKIKLKNLKNQLEVKLPRKYLTTETACKNAPATKGVKKHHRYCPGTFAL